MLPLPRGSYRVAFVRGLMAASSLLATVPGDAQTTAAPSGFTSLFNGRDLSGWRGRQGTYSPHEEAALTAEQRSEKQKVWDAERELHWRVDAGTREIVSDGKSVHLATARDYGDFELLVDWKVLSPGGDSGIYLRGYPQVQIWDPASPREQKSGAARGSGALWNNREGNPGKWPLAKVDRPIGEWNTFRIRMVGSRVWISLNGTTTVDGQVLENYYDRALPLVARGPLELQTHGSEIRFRNLYLRELTDAAATPWTP